jgi:hypothetical protein
MVYRMGTENSFLGKTIRAGYQGAFRGILRRIAERA